MLYIIIRLLILIFAVVIYKSLIKKRTKKTLLILCIIVLAVISLPFENLLFRFDTPEKLFNYSQNGQIVDVVHGEDSCMVYYEKNQGTYSRVIFRKKDNSYKMIFQTDISTVYDRFDSSGSFKIYHIKDTDDYYVSATCFVGADEIKVIGSSNVDTDFRQIEGTNFIYGYINSFNDDCYLSVGDSASNENLHEPD